MLLYLFIDKVTIQFRNNLKVDDEKTLDGGSKRHCYNKTTQLSPVILTWLRGDVVLAGGLNVLPHSITCNGWAQSLPQTDWKFSWGTFAWAVLLLGNRKEHVTYRRSVRTESRRCKSHSEQHILRRKTTDLNSIPSWGRNLVFSG